MTLFFWLVFTSFVRTFVMNVSKVLVGHLVVSESVRNNYYDFSGRLAAASRRQIELPNVNFECQR